MIRSRQDRFLNLVTNTAPLGIYLRGSDSSLRTQRSVQALAS